MKKPETKLHFKVNDKIIPVNGEINHKFNKDGNLIIKFTAGTVKLDKIELKLEKLNYIEEIKDGEKNTNTN